MNKIAVLLNPSAGGGKAFRAIERLELKLRQNDINPDISISEGEEHLRRLVLEKSSEFNAILGVGGDGTFNIVADALMRNDIDILFGMMNLGTRGDVAREFGTDTVERACEAVKEGLYKKTDLGIAQTEKSFFYFLGTASLGIENVIDRRLQDLLARHPFMERYIGMRPVQIAIGAIYAREAIKSGEVPMPIKIEHDHGTVDTRAILAVFNNTRYFDGGRIPSPGATPYDGKLDCCLIEGVSFPVLLNDYRLFAKGNHANRPEVNIMQSQRFQVTSGDGIEIQLDGEIKGKYHEIALSVKPKALKVIVNANYMAR